MAAAAVDLTEIVAMAAEVLTKIVTWILTKVWP